MVTGNLAGGVERWFARRLHPTRSVTGKFAAAGLLVSAVTVALGIASIWWVTTSVATTAAHAQAVYRGGLVLIATLVAAQVATMALLSQSIVDGLHTLERHTDEILEKGTHGTGFSADRQDEIGRISWNVAEIQAELSEQVAAIESLNRELTTVATTQSRTLAACSEGDLTRRMETETGTPQYDTLALRFNETMDRIETMVAEVRSFSQLVTAAADDAERRADEATDDAERITDSTKSINAEVHRQHDRVDSTASAIEDLAASIDSIATEAETVAERSGKAAAETDAGEESAERALDDLDAIREQTAASVERIELLSETVEDITEIVELIATVADRTDELAINAQIESARAGSDQSTHLTDRIRRLADDADDAAGEIELLLDDVRCQTDQALATIESTQAAVESGTETIEAALRSFETVSATVDATSEDITRIEGTTEQQAKRVAEVVAAADDLRSIGQRTASETATVAETADEQQATIESVASRLDRLTSVASQLDSQLGVFTARPPDKNGSTVGAEQ